MSVPILSPLQGYDDFVAYNVALGIKLGFVLMQRGRVIVCES